MLTGPLKPPARTPARIPASVPPMRTMCVGTSRLGFAREHSAPARSSEFTIERSAASTRWPDAQRHMPCLTGIAVIRTPAES